MDYIHDGLRLSHTPIPQTTTATNAADTNHRLPDTKSRSAFCFYGQRLLLQILAKDGTLYVLGTPKKCAFLEKASQEAKDGIKVGLLYA